MKSIEFLNETIFNDAVDLYFEFPDTETVLIQCAVKPLALAMGSVNKCGMHNQYMDEYFFTECKINDGVSVDEVEKKLRQSIFDKVA